MKKQDILIIGSGIAGLTIAIKCKEMHEDMDVTVITKSDTDECNTKYAQGGIAVVQAITDDFEKHIADTIRAGDGLCKAEVVDMVVREAPDRLNELIEWGARFDKNEKGEYDLGREGGHTENRVLHYKDVTGAEIERALLAKVDELGINLLRGRTAVDLITQHHLPDHMERDRSVCFGAYVMGPDGKIERYHAFTTVLASGGAGQVYRTTTNPLVATGDGIAMAYRAGAVMKNMEFVQFHPTAFYEPGESPAFLISEAVRGFGAKLRLRDGSKFMHKYDEREELASRDIVARAIDSELKRTGDDFVYLDCRHLDHEKFLEHFPTITDELEYRDINVFEDMIPVVPAAHYQCGGINTSRTGQTSITGLLACGECTNTGLHGANRLASNSLLEAVVYAERCFETAMRRLALLHDTPDSEEYYNVHVNSIPEWDATGTHEPNEMVQLKYMYREIQNVMTDLVGIVRSDERLKMAKRRLNFMYKEVKWLYDHTTLSPYLCELRNLVNVAHMITKASTLRTFNVGGYYNADRPDALKQMIGRGLRDDTKKETVTVVEYGVEGTGKAEAEKQGTGG